MRFASRVRGGVLTVSLLLAACAPASAPSPTSVVAPKPTTPPAGGAAAASPALSPAASAASPASPSPQVSVSPVVQAAASPVAAASAPGGAPTRLAVAYSNLITDNLPLWTARDMGIFDRSGLDVDLQYIASTNAMAALLAGQVQVASTGGSEVINSIANGADLVVVATLNPVYAVFLETRPEIKTAEDLKGKTIAITNPGASFDVATRVLLQHEGIDPDRDVTFIKTGSVANVTAALVSGNVDAGLANVPDTIKIEAAGLHPLFDMSKLGLPGSTVVLVLQRAYVDQQRAAVQRFVDDVVEALAREKHDQPGSVRLLEKYLQTQDQRGMEAAFDYYTQSILPALPFPRPEQFGDAQRTTSAVNPKAQDVSVESFLDPTFVQSGADRGLDKP
jgi:NitT/TauT family transport system substrate-binding protein